MAKRTKLPTSSILSDDLIHALSQGVAAMLGPEVMAAADQHGVRAEDAIRFQPVRRRCVEAREQARSVTA